jgi:hypothetical protein
MPHRASSYNWESDPDCEALSQMFAASAECDKQLLMEGSYTDQAWPPANQSSVQDFSPPSPLQSTLSNSFLYDCMDWDFACGTQPGTAAQWLPESVQPCDTGYYTSDDTHDGFQSASAFTNSPTDCSNSPTFINFPTSANDMPSPQTVVEENSSNLPVLQGSTPTTPKSWEACHSPADTKPAVAAKRGRPRKVRAPSETSSITSFTGPTCAARVPHNQVEKKYREGLNASLRQLQRKVPTLPQPADGAVGTVRPSKGMVIAGAIDYIRRIEMERDEAVQKVKDCGCWME